MWCHVSPPSMVCLSVSFCVCVCVINRAGEGCRVDSQGREERSALATRGMRRAACGNTKALRVETPRQRVCKIVGAGLAQQRHGARQRHGAQTQQRHGARFAFLRHRAVETLFHAPRRGAQGEGGRGISTWRRATPGGGQLLGSQHFSSQCREALSARWCSESEDWKHRDWDSGQRGFYFMFGEYACRRGDTCQRAR